MQSTTEFLNVTKILDEVPLHQGMKVAELGCGNAAKFLFTASRLVGQEGRAYGVDVLKGALESIREKADSQNLSNIVTVWSNLESVGATKIPQDSLDVAFLINILFQSKKHSEIFTEVARLLKKGGKLLVVDWLQTDAPMGPPLENRVSSKSLVETAMKCGFETEKEFSAGLYHFGLIFTKK